jgi:hypothetical protein
MSDACRRPPRYQPSLTVTESADCVRLQLGGLARGEGRSLQEAADDLVHRILALIMAIRSRGFTASGGRLIALIG